MAHSYQNTLLARLGFQDPDIGVPEHDMACRYLGQPEQLARLTEMVMRSRVEFATKEENRHWTWPRLASLREDLGRFHIKVDDASIYADRIKNRFHVRLPGHKEDIDVFFDVSKESFSVRGFTSAEKIKEVESWIEKNERAIRPLLVEAIFGHDCIPRVRGVLSLRRKVSDVDVRFVASDVAFEDPIAKGEGQYGTTIGFADVTYVVKCDLLRRETGENPDGTICSVDAWEEEKEHRTKVLIEVKAMPVPLTTILKQVKLYDQYLISSGTMRIAFRGNKTTNPLIVATLYALPAADIVLLKSQGILPIRLGEPFQRWLAEQRAANETATPSVEEF